MLYALDKDNRPARRRGDHSRLSSPDHKELENEVADKRPSADSRECDYAQPDNVDIDSENQIQMNGNTKRILEEVMPLLPQERDCLCKDALKGAEA